MAAPVWVLSVDLQTKTATFQTGLAQAARSARGAFTEIKTGAAEAGAATGYSMMEARHSVMILGEELGAHLPRALTTFIASLGPLGPALEAAFPLLAISLGASLLIEKLAEMHAAGEKLTEEHIAFGTAANMAFNSMREKVLQAQMKVDDLSNNHLAALHRQLQIIDLQSMEDLIHQFDEVAKTAEPVLKSLESHWYTLGKGSEGASHAFENLKTQYQSLMAVGKADEAHGLLTGTLAQDKKVLDLLKARTVTPTGDTAKDNDNYNKAVAAHQELDRLQIKTGANLKDQIAAQAQIVASEQEMLDLEHQRAALTADDKKAANMQERNRASGEAANSAREAAESAARIGQQQLAADRAQADASLDIQRATLEQRLASDLEFAARDRAIKQQENTAEIAALDKTGKDYANQLKTLNNKSLEIDAEYSAKVIELRAKSSQAAAARDLTALEQGEREKIEATQKGSTERIAAIDAALKEEQSRNLEDTNNYRQLLTQRVEAVRQEVEEEQKARDAATKQAIASRKAEAEEQQRHGTEMTKIQTPKGVDDFSVQRAQLDQEYNYRHEQLEKDLADTQSMGEEKLQEQARINAEIEQLDKKHQDQLAENTAAQMQAEKTAAMDTANTWGQSLLKVGEGHERMSKVAEQAFDGMIAHSLQAALMEVAHEKTAQLAHAEAAAAASWHAMSSIPVVGPALGAAAAAMTFAGAMAFEAGGIVPGDPSKGDSVPALLKPGEGIAPNSMMDNLNKMAKDGGFSQKAPTVHVHVRPTYHVNTIDGDGMQDALEKHTDQLQEHFSRTVRRMNK